MSSKDHVCQRLRRGKFCRAPLSAHHPETLQCPGLPGGSTFRYHQGAPSRAGNSFSVEEAQILDAVFSSMLHGKLTEQVIRGYVRQHPGHLLSLATKGRKMLEAIAAQESRRVGKKATAARLRAPSGRFLPAGEADLPVATGHMIDSAIQGALKAS